MNKDTVRRSFWRIFEVLCYLAIISLLILCLLTFKWGNEIHWRDPNYIVDGEYLGNLGDFTAGTVGSIIALLSVFLLYRTLRLQSIANRDNRTLLEVQRFNDLYFNLIGLLDKEVPHSQAIHSYRSMIQQSALNEKNYTSRNYAAVRRYEQIYEAHSELGTYFRTLYRILDLIAISNISDRERVKYSKILRARFDEDELFLMRYDSLTLKGNKLGRYLWDYHILKHLPATATAELMPATLSMNARERDVIDRLYESLRTVAVSSSKFSTSPNILSGPFMLKILPVKLVNESDIRLIVDVDILKLNASRAGYPYLATMTALQAEELISDIVELFNSFAPYSHATADLRRRRVKSSLTLLSILIERHEI